MKEWIRLQRQHQDCVFSMSVVTKKKMSKALIQWLNTAHSFHIPHSPQHCDSILGLWWLVLILSLFLLQTSSSLSLSFMKRTSRGCTSRVSESLDQGGTQEFHLTKSQVPLILLFYTALCKPLLQTIRCPRVYFPKDVILLLYFLPQPFIDYHCLENKNQSSQLSIKRLHHWVPTYFPF